MSRDDERHEYRVLHGQLDALDEDIARARADLQALTTAHFEGFFSKPSHPSTARPAEGERVKLRDGSVAIIRPLQPADASMVREGFEHLSAVERYRRFIFDQEHLTTAEAAELTTVDRDHVAYGAIDPATGAGVGLARYVCDHHDETCAVAAVIVVNAWQGRGLATRLLRRLADHAREAGIERLEAHMIVGDTSSQRMFESVGQVETTQRGRGALDVTVRLA
jgi:GNAT superfamily N-acetyltransferase